ncbi:Hypothetical predicted protein [Pelobates cultripes]|uniref:Helix-turn-helix domain-containing protein n=1 Tax=Pelobates cultripes TaxID=61616 RepID=A0AAD1WCE4_PELCU|nr:Hypothetical predicted protein [Pelobates cultripes]
MRLKDYYHKPKEQESSQTHVNIDLQDQYTTRFRPKSNFDPQTHKASIKTFLSTVERLTQETIQNHKVIRRNISLSQMKSTELEAQEMDQYLNELDTPIRFTSNISAPTIQYLDLEISVKEQDISYCLYNKDTDRNTLLHNKSAHPRMLKESLHKAQFLRVARNNSDKHKMEEQIEEMTQKFLERGYRHQELLKAHANMQVRKPPAMVFPMSYNDASPKLAKIIKLNWKMLASDDTVPKVFKESPLIVSKGIKH